MNTVPKSIAVIVRGAVVAAIAVGCAEEVPEEPAVRDPLVWTTHIDPLPVAPGEEVVGQCVSWTLNNEEPIYVNRVDLVTDVGAHHSNWVWVPDRHYDGPDGAWPCAERDFFKEAAPFNGGGILFLQSTQSTEDSQRFLPGAVIALPPRVRIIGDLHLLNVSPAPIEIEMDMTVTGIREEDVTTRLSPMAVSYDPLEIPPRGRSEFTLDCMLDQVHRDFFDRPLDFDIHYALPHYHAFGDLLQVEIVGGPRDGEVIAETRNRIGEPLSITYDEPVSMIGAQGLRVRCGYENPTDETIYWGNGDGEMCIAVFYTSSPNIWLGVVREPNRVLGVDAGVTQNTSDCDVWTMVATHTSQGF